MDVTGAPEAGPLERQINEWTAADPVQGVYRPLALDERPLAGLDLAGWREAPSMGLRRAMSN